MLKTYKRKTKLFKFSGNTIREESKIRKKNNVTLQYLHSALTRCQLGMGI